VVHGAGRLLGGRVESGADHRIAMAGAVMGMLAEAPVDVTDVACVATSYPSFWNDARMLGAEVEG